MICPSAEECASSSCSSSIRVYWENRSCASSNSPDARASSTWDARSLVSTVSIGPHCGEQVCEVRNLLLQAGDHGIGGTHLCRQVRLQRADLIGFIRDLGSQIR